MADGGAVFRVRIARVRPKHAPHLVIHIPRREADSAIIKDWLCAQAADIQDCNEACVAGAVLLTWTHCGEWSTIYNIARDSPLPPRALPALAAYWIRESITEESNAPESDEPNPA